MQPFQRAKLLSGLSRKHRAILESIAPPFAIASQTRWYAAEPTGSLSCMLDESEMYGIQADV
jgi:hypothetical protein